MQLGEGILTLRVKEGKLSRDTEVFGQMSPYVTISFKGKKFKTKVHDNGGKKPAWTDEFVLEVTDHTEEMVLRVWDQDMTTSDAVGFTKIKMSSMMINCGVEDWFTIMYDNKPAGEIMLSTTFEPLGGNEYENMKGQMEAQNQILDQQAKQAAEQIQQMATH
jgi:Ca2+-dependent lipid-binding protein